LLGTPPIHLLKEILLKPSKLISVLGLGLAFFVGCSKTETNTNSSNTTNANAKASISSTPATTTTPVTPPTTTNSSATSSSGAGEVFTHSEGGIQFTAPANWKSEKGEGTMTLLAPHNALSVIFWVPKGDDFDQAVEDLSAELKTIIKNPEVTSPGQETMHNGMKAYTSSGTGEVNDQQIVWEVDILQAKKPVFVVSFAAPALFAQHKGEYNQLLGSIKKVN